MTDRDLTIAQALRLVAKLKGQLSELQQRGSQSVSWKDRAEPAYKFAPVLEEIEITSNRLVALQSRMTAAGVLTVVDVGGKTIRLSEAVRRAQELKSLIAWLRVLPVRSQPMTLESESDYDVDVGKTVRRDVTWYCDLPEAKRDAKVRELQDKFDALNLIIESVNHMTLLPE